MRVTINGDVRKRELSEIKEAVHFYADHLMPQSLIKKLKIIIRFVQGLENAAEVTHNGESSVRPKSFLIYINSSLSRIKTLKSLGHEMTHVKQFATGELTYLASSVKWKDGYYPFPDEGDAPPETYWNAPWEVEAFGRETCLYHLYKKHAAERKRAEV